MRGIFMLLYWSRISNQFDQCQLFIWSMVHLSLAVIGNICHWSYLSLVVIGHSCHWLSLVVIGCHWSLVVIGCHWSYLSLAGSW